MKLTLSSLPHTWILDVDGTIVKHNGYKIDGYDTLLDGVKEWWSHVSHDDQILLLTARKGTAIDDLKSFLQANNLWYTHLIGDCPVGERILVNDSKPSGLKMAHVVNKDRDALFNLAFEVDNEI